MLLHNTQDCNSREGDMKSYKLLLFIFASDASLNTCESWVKTVKGEYMAFGTFYDCENHFFDTTNFSQSIKKYPFAGRGVYLIEAKVVDEFGFCSLEVMKMARLAPKPDPRY